MRNLHLGALVILVFVASTAAPQGQGNAVSQGKRLFDAETFGGNGRTCRTCHSETTGTLSPADVQQLFKTHPNDPLFLTDGSDDGNGTGTSRIRQHATIRMSIPLHPNVKLAATPRATNAIVFRGIPTTLNMPALEERERLRGVDPVIMLDGRQPTLERQALGAIQDHAQGTVAVSGADLQRIKEFELTNTFFSSPEVRKFASGGPEPELPRGNTAAEKRGRRFFEDVVDFVDFKHGACAGCHAGPMLDRTNLFAELVFGVPQGTRFQNIAVSLIDANGMHATPQAFIVKDSTGHEETFFSTDPGRSLITGVSPLEDPTFSNWEAFKIPQLRGIRDTGPYFHDNSAKTLEDVMKHYDVFFGPGFFTDQDNADIVAFMKLLR